MKCCKTCRWAVWERSEKGNIRTKRAGRCFFPKAVESDIQIKLPYASRETRSQLLIHINERYYIWVDKGEDCECYEAL
jgi:hypothetical protein